MAQASAGASRAAADVTDALLGSGIAPSDLRTTEYSIRPEYDHSRQSQRLIGYRVSNTLNVVVRDTEDAGRVIDAVIGAGGDATVVDGIRFGIADTTGLESAARQRAWEDARSKADQLARLAGVVLGPVVSISEVTGRSPGPARARVALADTPIQPGGQAVTVALEVEFAIEG